MSSTRNAFKQRFGEDGLEERLGPPHKRSRHALFVPVPLPIPPPLSLLVCLLSPACRLCWDVRHAGAPFTGTYVHKLPRYPGTWADGLITSTARVLSTGVRVYG
jgi:hypothetical protein